MSAAIDNYRKNDAGRVEFPCEWKGELVWATFGRWAALTGIHRNTIKTRFYSDRTARQCIGLDKIIPVARDRKPQTSQASKERRQVEVAKQFLCARW